MTQKELDRLTALMASELPYRADGALVAGVDEVGRGPLAGPVTVACVAMPIEPLVEFVNDSKKVTERRRGIAAENIKNLALRASIVSVSPERIDEINILNATKEAMRQAALEVNPDILLIDAVELKDMPFSCVPIIGGDAKCYSIAAASILAKVTRDAYMQEMDALYPQYGFARNKGYGTAEHIAALREFGPCPIHRMSFLKNILK
ncbi:MAG: ribonuclease HII [Clostridia bacterium]|nr:ribonuclease HII [Clostridia bacterium]